MLKFVLALVLVASCISEDAKPDVEVEDGVLVLTEDNFESVVNSNEFVLVEFYAPWCGHCKSLAPEYAKAATKLAEEDPSIKLGKVDATIHKELGTKYEVRGYPTLKFFRDGSPLEYTGGRTGDTIVSWLKKKSGPPAVTIVTKDDAEKLLKENVAVIGFFSDVESVSAKAFLKAAGKNDDVLFGICSDKALFEEYKVEKEGVVLFKKFDEERVEKLEDLTDTSISEFVQVQSTPLLTEFSQEAAQKLFSQKDKAFFFLAMSKKSTQYEDVAQAVRNVAKKSDGKIIAIYLNTDSPNAAQVINYLGLTDEDYPTYRLLDLEKNLKYKPKDSDVSEEKMGAFVNSYISGELRPFLKSADIPKDWDAKPVKVLTGKNFVEVAKDETKHVFVEFYAPWCGHCKSLVPIWDELAEKYEGVENVVIAKVDSTENELEEVSIKGFPTLKFFPANSNEIVDYKGDRSLDDLLKFMSKYAEPKTEEKEVEEAPEPPKDASPEEDKKKDEL